MTIGRRIEAITWADEEPLLLSGILAFLSHGEVADVLEAWAENTSNPFVRDLRRLSQALTVSFPTIPTPSPTQPIQQRLHGRLEDGYLGAMFAARQAPDLNEERQDGLNCLRLWILIKALDYSWVQVRPEEQSLLAATIKNCLRQISSESALAAAFVVLSEVTRRTMDTVGTLKLTQALETDWTIDLDTGSVKRLPSRPDVRWKQTPETQSWTKNLAGSWEFELRHPLIDVLRHARQENPSARCLSDLWKYAPSPYASFRKLCRDSEGLERVSSYALGLIGERLAFAEEGDATYARLVMAPPTAGVAGSGSYPSWSLRRPARTIESISNGLIVSTTPDSEDVNGLGSELDPDDLLLRDALSTAARHVETGVPGDLWTAHHNRLTAYTVAVLLACTAARPSRSPFESITHFDLKNQRVCGAHQSWVHGFNGNSQRGDSPRYFCTMRKEASLALHL